MIEQGSGEEAGRDAAPSSGAAVMGRAPVAPTSAMAPEDVLDACFEAAAVGLMVVSPDGVILRGNAAAAAILGVPPERLSGRSILELSRPEDRAATVAALQRFAAGERTPRRIEKWYRRPDGSEVLVEATVVPAFGPDGRHSHQLATLCDLTERRALAAELRATSRRLDRLVDANVIGVAVATEQGVKEVNEELLRLAGITRAQFEARGLDWRAITPPEHLERDHAAMREMLARGTCTPFEKDWIRPDGTRVPLLVGAALLEREPLEWIAFALDLTERRRAERERDRLLAEARAAREVAESALAARDALLARITHDLRTPIGANLGYAELMLEGLPLPLPPVHAARVERMRRNQQHMLALLDELLAFARGGAARQSLTLELLPVGTLLAELESLIAPQARAAGVVYACVTPEPALRVFVDRVKALQVLANLVGNAVKFTPPGGRITLTAAADPDRVRVAVADTGVGIPAAQLDRIFEPFVRLGEPEDGHASRGTRGFGLGLAISRDLARAMGGELTVESAPGVGSTFTLTLPRAPGA